MSRREVVLFVNRSAGTGTGQELVAELESRMRLEDYDVATIDVIADLAPYVARRKTSISTVIAAGGDGTVETVVNAIDGDVPIAVFPLGTENLLAKYLGIAAEPARFVRMVSAGKTIQLDAGRANGKLFLLMLSCGFDAEVVRRVHAEREGNISHLAYAKPILESIWNYDYPTLRVELGSESVSCVEQICQWAFVFNAPAYAGGLQIVSEADPSDGAFDVATFSGDSFWHGLWHFSAVVLGQHRQLPSFTLSKSSRLRIESVEDRDIPFQIDGDPGGFLPVDIEVLPQHLTLVVVE